MTYRTIAIKSLERAKLELNNTDEHRIKYAALELRMTLESIIFDRAKLYKEELSELEFNQWQPKNLLQTLLDIDPIADKSEGFRMGEQETIGKPAKLITDLGVDRRLTLKEVKNYYNKLGNFLHTNTLEQIQANKYAPPAKMKLRCTELISILDEVLNSPIYNTRMKHTTRTQCVKCDKKIVRAIPDDFFNLEVKCPNCDAEYLITNGNNGFVTWTPQRKDVPCASNECSTISKFFNVELVTGTEWHCSGCGKRNRLSLGVILAENQS
ncbi:hypothetical protein [Colwellia sp. MB3u-4]|uniref:hypothetical protein n=1 Tax=Colwellia sp. MB3u-4 TaxID=2759822 RepID=UPI0015F611F5|nr:hypothetical protein [Colwellia sp. MB3u-4]MBA6287596.1 hypothetical protein [Colwellia sp. MB3u-4]